MTSLHDLRFSPPPNSKLRLRLCIKLCAMQRWSPRGRPCLEDTFWSPWSQSLKSSKIALSSTLGQHYFWNVEISLENARNLVENLQGPFFWFPQVEIARKKIFCRPFLPEKNFWRPFCFGRTLASVSLVLGLEIFLCPWPQALCPRLHLRQYAYQIPVVWSLHLSIVGTPSWAVAYNIAKVQSNKIHVALLPV